MPKSLGLLLLVCVVCLHMAGCSSVTGTIRPKHFQFYDVVNQVDLGPGGWRAACVQAWIKNAKLGTSWVCVISVEVPMENTVNGVISVQSAQRTCARLANDAAYEVLMLATDALPLGIACETLRDSFRAKLAEAISGSRVTKRCRPESIPVVFGDP